ncbi:MAG: AraC family transcriptional regulator [Ferruginibacter sp.]
MNLYIKNMVCNRCINAVRQELDKLHLQTNSIILGEVSLAKEPSEQQFAQLKNNLDRLGFEVLDDSRKKLIEKIKNIVVEEVHYGAVDKKHTFSDLLSKKLHKDYSYLSGLFSEVEGVTIEKYIINQKIEKVKELIMYDELNFSEIAFQLGYSSVGHLSAQFKKTTGLTPSYYKNMSNKVRKPLDDV